MCVTYYFYRLIIQFVEMMSNRGLEAMKSVKIETTKNNYICFYIFYSRAYVPNLSNISGIFLYTTYIHNLN